MIPKIKIPKIKKQKNLSSSPRRTTCERRAFNCWVSADFSCESPACYCSDDFYSPSMMESGSSHSLSSPSEIPLTTESETHHEVIDVGTSRKRAREVSSQLPHTIPRRRSPYWEHCEKGTRKAIDGSLQPIGICKYCKSEIPTASGSTSGLKNHLVKRCKISPLYEMSEKEKGRIVLTNETMGQGSGRQMVPTHAFNQKLCEKKFTEFVIIDKASFRTIEGQGFVALLNELQPSFRIPDLKEVAGMIYALFLAEKSKVKSMISGQRVSLTIATWTSIQSINYMVVTAHFLDSDWKLHKKILNFTKINSRVGVEIGKEIEISLYEWGIEQVFSIVIDDASSNNIAIDFLKRRMKIRNTLLFEGKYFHLRCACHILNLIVKDGLKELKSSIKSIRNAVVFLHSSSPGLNMFREYAKLARFSSTSIVPMDVKTRWNSTLKMLEVALKYRMVFERMGEECFPFMEYFNENDDKGKKRIGPPTTQDWENAKAFVHFLKMFHAATLMLSASKTPTSQLIYKSMIALQIEIERKSNDDSDQILKKVASSMKEKFDKYWGDWNKMNHLIFIATVLDPRNKFMMIEVGMEILDSTPEKVKEFIDLVKNSLITLWTEYKRVNDTLIVKRENMQIECGGGDDTSSGGDLCDELLNEMYARIEEKRLQKLCNEVDVYLADGIEDQSNSSFNLLEWWKQNKTRFPTLSLIAKDLFAIPSSTVSSAFAFGLGKRVVDPFRSSLSPTMVEALVCTSDWLKGEDFDLYKDPTDDDLDLYKELEEIEKNANVNEGRFHTSFPASIYD